MRFISEIELNSFLKAQMKKTTNSILFTWVLFALCLILLFLTSIVSVVPDSFADKSVRFLQPLLAILSVAFLVHAVYKTVISFKKNKQ